MHQFSREEQDKAKVLLPIFLKVVGEPQFPAEVGPSLAALKLEEDIEG